MRNFKIFNKVNSDDSEYILVLSLNNNEVKSKIEYSINDMLIESNKFLNECIEDFNIDTRFDRLELELKCGF